MEWIYPILGKQKCLPFYLSGVGVAEPEYHVRREEGLVSHQLLYTKAEKVICSLAEEAMKWSREACFIWDRAYRMNIIR